MQQVLEHYKIEQVKKSAAYNSMSYQVIAGIKETQKTGLTLGGEFWKDKSHKWLLKAWRIKKEPAKR